MDLKELYERTIREGKPFILTEDMIGVEIKIIDKPIQSLDDLVMVHKTDYFPYGAVKTPYETRKAADCHIKCIIDGEEKEFIIPSKSYRNTAHFCLNGAVESHAYGEWDETKYAILMPLAKNKDKIIAGSECDLFSWGSVPITDNGYILCPKDEIDKMKEANPSAHIIGYEGTSVTPYVNIFLSNILEYKYKMPTQNSREWDSGHSEDYNSVVKLIKENGWEYIDHNGSKWDRDDLTQQFTDLLVGWLKVIINEKLLYSTQNVDEIKKNIIRIFDASDPFSGFSYAGAFTNKDKFSIICKMIKSETGIDLSNFAETETIKSFYWEITAKSTVADYIINELRIRALKEKVQTGNMTEEDIFELNYYNEFGTYPNITPDRKEIFRKLENMHSKSLKELTKDEIEMILEATNFKLQNINKLSKDNQYSFKLIFLDEVTEEQSKKAATVGMYLQPRKSGIYLVANIPNSFDIYSKLSGIDIRALENKLNYIDDTEESYIIEKQIVNIPNCHLIEFNCSRGIGDITDFDLSKCDTVEDLEISIMKYVECFFKFISGQKIEFDSLGNNLSKQENEENHIIDNQTSKISEIVDKFAALSGIQDKQVCEDLISKLSKLNINDSIDSILVSLKDMLERGVLTVEQIISNADLIISLNPDKYKSFDDLINRLKWIESMNMEHPQMPLTENHKLVVEAFDKFNELVGTQFDSFYTGGLMGYLATNHELERYHGDLDLFINEEQLPLLYSIVQQSKDFEFVSNLEHKAQSGHEFKINYKGTEMSMGLFLFSRLPNNEVVLKDYYQDRNKELVVNESHLSGRYASMLFPTTPREHNGFAYKMQSLEGIYYSKKGSRPKDEYDAKIIESCVDMEIVSRLDNEKQDNYTTQNRAYDSNVVAQLDKTIRNQNNDETIIQEVGHQRS